MNVIKKVIIILFLLNTFAFDMICMEKRGGSTHKQHNSGLGVVDNGFQSDDEKESTLPKLTKSQANFLIFVTAFTTYFIQFASVYSIDSTKPSIIRLLALIRNLGNILQIIGNTAMLYDVKRFLHDLQLNDSQRAGVLIDTAATGYNILQDYRILKNAKNLAIENTQRKSDKNLNRKKFVQAVWLTLNTVSTFIGKNPYFKLSVDLSEMVRQQLMYRMVAKYKK